MSSIEIARKCEKAWMAIMKDGKPKNWVVYGVNKKMTKLKVQASGPGGLADVLQNLAPDSVNFAALYVV
jgi:hypothetical protein